LSRSISARASIGRALSTACHSDHSLGIVCLEWMEAMSSWSESLRPTTCYESYLCHPIAYLRSLKYNWIELRTPLVEPLVSCESQHGIYRSIAIPCHPSRIVHLNLLASSASLIPVSLGLQGSCPSRCPVKTGIQARRADGPPSQNCSIIERTRNTSQGFYRLLVRFDIRAMQRGELSADLSLDLIAAVGTTLNRTGHTSPLGSEVGGFYLDRFGPLTS